MRKKLTAVLFTALIFICASVWAEDTDKPAESTPVMESSQPETPVVAAAPAPTPANVPSPVVAAVPKPPAEDIDLLTAKKIETLAQQMSEMQAQVTQTQQLANQYSQQISQLQYTVYGLAGLVVLLALLSMVWRPKKIKQTKSPVQNLQNTDTGKTIKIEDDTTAEYDFMGSTEGIPAKLDLARAYIAMEDYNAARETLAEILGEGSEEHREEAKALLKKIDQK